jgi:selenocysteine-specific elongation factor
VHGRSVERAAPGQRVAANLQGIDVAAVERGDLVTEPASLEATRLLDVRVEHLTSANAPLKDLARVSLHLLTAETPARVKLVNGGRLEPGEAGCAQLRTARPIVALPGDRFILRRPSPPMTIAGGTVLHNAPPKLRGHGHDNAARYERFAAATPAVRLKLLVDEAGPAGIDAGTLRARTGMSGAVSGPLLETFVSEGSLVRMPGPPPRYLGAAAAELLRRAVTDHLRRFHAREPLAEGAPREELRTRVFSDSHPEVFRGLLADMVARGIIRAERERVALADHTVSLSPEEARLSEGLDALFRDGGANPPDLAETAKALGVEVRRVEKLLHLLLGRGRLVRIPDGKIFHTEAIDILTRRLREHRATSATIDIGAFKDLSGTTRKNAIPLLEYLDQILVTRREGSVRRILPPPDGD